IAIGGGLSQDARKVFAHGIAGLESSIARDMPLREALSDARANIADAAERAMRLILVGREIQQTAAERGQVRGRRKS
ncbi:MAG: glycerate kinase, partial [Gammaproteobacteria bacterium]